MLQEATCDPDRSIAAVQNTAADPKSSGRNKTQPTQRRDIIPPVPAVSSSHRLVFVAERDGSTLPTPKHYGDRENPVQSSVENSLSTPTAELATLPTSPLLFLCYACPRDSGAATLLTGIVVHTSDDHWQGEGYMDPASSSRSTKAPSYGAAAPVTRRSTAAISSEPLGARLLLAAQLLRDLNTDDLGSDASGYAHVGIEVPQELRREQQAGSSSSLEMAAVDRRVTKPEGASYFGKTTRVSVTPPPASGHRLVWTTIPQ